MMKSRPRKWQDLTAKQQTAVLATGSLQITLATAAWLDLAGRPAAQVNGPKGLWAVAIGLNLAGPILYFIRGIRR